jgi:hypothetical protein
LVSLVLKKVWDEVDMMKVYVESKDDIVEKQTDDRGRITLGTKYGDKQVQIAILEVENDE